ncbi:MAG: hypothetical protein EPO21_20180 [Chloroflexota bacterium]|nr:MAG: hypothetical protein EPO21_20180 [Chloroflexota bacterium]
MKRGQLSTIVLGLVLAVGTVGCSAAGQAASVPANPSVQADVSLKGELRWTGNYATDIQPIFDSYCVQCHNAQRPENGLRLDSYDNVMKGTTYGKVVVPGSAPASTLAQVVQGKASEKIRMPHQGPRLSPNRIQNIVLWIEAGAKQD